MLIISFYSWSLRKISKKWTTEFGSCTYDCMEFVIKRVNKIKGLNKMWNLHEIGMNGLNVRLNNLNICFYVFFEKEDIPMCFVCKRLQNACSKEESSSSRFSSKSEANAFEF